MYQLVNPYISGQFTTSFDGGSPLKAATKCWESLSAKFTNCIPNFAFTLQDGGNKLHHFLVKESVSSDGEVSFKISPYTKTDDGKVSKFMSKVSKLQEGGKRKKKSAADDDDSSSSDSDSEELNRLRYEHIKNKANNSKLIGNYMWYWSYYPTIYDVTYYDSFYIPTLVAPYMPYVNISWL